MVHETDQGLGVQASVGVGIPGSPSQRSGTIRNANSTALNGRPLVTDLEQAIGRPVRVANDANCFALSEATDGAAAGLASVFGVILGTGVGGGLVVNGHGLPGLNGIAGEWGHNPLPAPLDDERPGPRCYCGRSGCIETWLCGPGFAADYARQGGRQSLTAAQIITRMRAGEALAVRCFDRYVERMARALAGVINVFDPHAIVLGGGMSNIDELYDRVPGAWQAHIFSDHVATPLLPNRHGDSSGVRGAAWLWPLQSAAPPHGQPTGSPAA